MAETEEQKNPRAVVFDMDGLIFNSEDLYDVACETLLNRRGRKFSLELKLEMMGKKAEIAFQMMRESLELDDSIDTLKRELEKEFESLINTQLAFMPGFDSLLQELETHDVPIAVATSSHKSLAHRLLNRFDLVQRFQFVLTGDDVENGKPHPEIYLKAAELFGLKPNELLVLEDSHAGSLAATRAGATSIAVPNRHTRSCDFSHVDQIANTLNDPNILSRLGIVSS